METGACPLCAFEGTAELQRTAPLAATGRLVQSGLAEAGSVLRFAGCTRCGMVFRTPRPSAEQLERYYTQTLPPQEPGMMAALGATPELAAARYAVRYAGLYRDLAPLAGAPGHLVDFGGWDGRSLLPWLAGGWRGTLVDPGAAGRPRVDERIAAFATAEQARASLPPADVVTSYHCVEHLRDLHAWRAEALSLGRPGTLWVIEVPFDLIYVRGLIRRRPLPQPAIHEQHLNFFVPESLRALGEVLGLMVEQVRIVVTEYWHGPVVGLRLVGRQQAAPGAVRRPRFGSPAAMRRSLRLRLPLWRRWSGLKYRAFRLRSRPIQAAPQGT